MYYRGAAAAIVVYDLTNKESFNGAKSWVKELQRRGDPNVVIALAGNKSDLQNKRNVDCEVSLVQVLSLQAYKEARQYAEENGILHMETSAKDATNIKGLFHEIGSCDTTNNSEHHRSAQTSEKPTSIRARGFSNHCVRH